MIPLTNNNAIINPQYPRQKAPRSTPVMKAPLEPGRRFSVRYFEGFWQCCRHDSFTAVIDKALRKSIFLRRQFDLSKISASETQSQVIPSDWRKVAFKLKNAQAARYPTKKVAAKIAGFCSQFDRLNQSGIKKNDWCHTWQHHSNHLC
tara:strand:+ start:2368 stop:2811 length:444 start_codon:yes stop_codon:yes gene_type:complete